MSCLCVQESWCTIFLSHLTSSKSNWLVLKTPLMLLVCPINTQIFEGISSTIISYLGKYDWSVIWAAGYWQFEVGSFRIITLWEIWNFFKLFFFFSFSLTELYSYFYKNSLISATKKYRLLILIVYCGIMEVSSLVMGDGPILWYWCISTSHRETKGSFEATYFVLKIDPYESSHRKYIIILYYFYDLGEPSYPLWVNSKLFVATINFMRRSFARMEAVLLIISTRKVGKAMKFIMSDFPLLVCVKFSRYEGENNFFRFFQPGRLRYKDILKRL